jgi:hypothetical protein
MDKLINRLRIVFLVLFALGAGASWGYQLFWAKPRKECEARGHWWSNYKRVCAYPIDITQITGRPLDAPPMPRAATAPAAPPAAAAVQPPAQAPER